MISLNEMALDIVEDMMDYEEELKIKSFRLENGATVIDCGINTPGGYDAGIMITRVCMGGLVDVNLKVGSINDKPVAFIHEHTDHPALACLGSQKAGWQIKIDDFFAMGSGPARAIALKPKKTYEQIKYEDDADFAVILLESNKMPSEKVMNYIARECEIDPSNTYALIAPTSSICGSVQISGRVIETAIFKMVELGYDPKKVISAAGTCPIAPLKSDDLKSMGATNDSIIYHGMVFLTVTDYEDVLKKTSSDNSSDYGKPFFEIFKEANYDFYSIDAGLFAPAKVSINSAEKGETYVFGRLNPDVLMRSYGMD